MIPKEAVSAAAKAAYIYHSNEPGFDAEAAWNDMAGAEDWERGQWELEAQAALEAAAPYLRAQVLLDAADEWERRSETFLRTMQNMSELIGTYTHDDIVRYGAYSAEANTTAHRLRARATTERGQHD